MQIHISLNKSVSISLVNTFVQIPRHQGNGALRVERRQRLVAVQAVIDLGLPRSRGSLWENHGELLCGMIETGQNTYQVSIVAIIIGNHLWYGMMTLSKAKKHICVFMVWCSFVHCIMKIIVIIVMRVRYNDSWI